MDKPSAFPVTRLGIARNVFAVGEGGRPVELVLVVGDRPERASALAESLGILGVDAIASDMDWKLALRSLVAHDVALIVLDIDASEKSRSFFEMLRELADVPTLVRGPMSNADLVISYLESGAIDYVAKTTPPHVLAAKIHSISRAKRSNGTSAEVIVAGNVRIDLQNRRVTRETGEVSLTPLEFRLLGVLAEKIGRPCTREELLGRVWGPDFTNCLHYLRLYIGYLRQKLEEDPRRPQLLLNEWGYGYRLVEPTTRRNPTGARPTLRFAAPR